MVPVSNRLTQNLTPVGNRPTYKKTAEERMNADQLKALQAPVKKLYRDNPDRARLTLEATGTLDADRIVCVVNGFTGPVPAGLHPATGGDGKDACSGDMLLEALVGCAGVTLKAVATAMGITIRTGKIRAQGDGFSRHARCEQGRPGRLPDDPPLFRSRHRRTARPAPDPGQAHGTLLRRLSNPGEATGASS